MYKHLSALVALGALTTAFAVPSIAQNTERSKVGQLSCDLDGIGRIVASKVQVNCMFIPLRPGRRENYTAIISKLDRNLGVTEGNKIVWTVYAPNKRPFGALAGDYRGAKAETTGTIGAGSDGDVLAGGSNRTVILQPASSQRPTNQAIGVAALELRPGW